MPIQDLCFELACNILLYDGMLCWLIILMIIIMVFSLYDNTLSHCTELVSHDLFFLARIVPICVVAHYLEN